MNDLLLYVAIAMLGISIVLFFIQQIVCAGKNLDIFKHLLKDRNYPVEFAEKILTIKFSEKETNERDEFNFCWLKTSCRKRTTKEETLLHHAKWTGRCGGFALFLLFSKLSPFWTILLAIIFAFSLVGLYRAIIVSFFEIKTFKKAWSLYTQQREI